MTRLPLISRHWVRDLSLASKIIVLVMGVSSAVLVLAGFALIAYDSSTARTGLTRDVGILADVVGETSTAAVSFGDAKAAAVTLGAVAVNRNVQIAAIIHEGAVFARFDRTSATADDQILDHLDPALARTPRAGFTFQPDSLRLLRPILLDHELIGGVYIESGLTELNERRRRLIGITTAVLFGTLTVAFLLSSRLQRLISGPVLRLTEVTRVVLRDSNYDIRVENSSHDEVGVLIDGFNGMLSEIQRRNRQLLDHQGALEREVEVRTSDLRQANTDLLIARDKAMEGSRAKSQFLANMSHEIRTPMNGIIGMTELALGTGLTIEQRECLDTVKFSADSLLALLNDILDFSKIESQKLELEAIPISISDLVEDTLKPLALHAHLKGIELIADVAADVPDGIAGDPGRIAQVIANLVGNAIKFTAEGHVLAQVRCDQHFGDHVRLLFSISDTGIGIPADKHATIFEAFSQADGTTTRRFGGTGLGLTISTTLVHLMGGRIWVDSDPGQGSTFHFSATFPLAIVPTRRYTPLLVGLPVLIVDDNEVNRRIFLELLGRWEMKPTAVGSGAAALAALAEASQRGAPYALVLLDANMPGMDGFAVAEQMAARPALGGPTIMMLTSSGKFGDSARARELGVGAYLTKPIRHADLFDAITRTLRPSAAAPADGRKATGGGPAVVGVRVLLAEDNLVNQRVAVGLLTRRGHLVHVVDNGVEALAALDRAAYDVVLMDIQMLEMGGVEATRAIRAREESTGGHTRIVAMTAHAMKGDRERYIAAGMDGYISKPIDQAALFAIVELKPATPPAGVAGTRAAAGMPVDFGDIHRRLGDEELVAEMIALFLEDYPARMAEINAAVVARDHEATLIGSHALKGAASNLSAEPFVASIEALELLVKRDVIDPLEADAAWFSLAAEGERLLTVLRAAILPSKGANR
jgi:signal transduction histidine kinase/DNA-binding response OmpR family regulator/HPt (histidine-containing phosphotransfer) domain-containing protein